MPGSTQLLYCVEGGELETGGTSWVINMTRGQDRMRPLGSIGETEFTIDL